MKKDFILDVFITATTFDDRNIEGKKFYFKAIDFEDKTIHTIMNEVARSIKKQQEEK
jgi:hypothetical protein|tara:strand:+ start:789 stop:959 length:171 start_codon:yes stop_codon:yes gene_type:complete